MIDLRLFEPMRMGALARIHHRDGQRIGDIHRVVPGVQQLLEPAAVVGQDGLTVREPFDEQGASFRSRRVACRAASGQALDAGFPIPVGSQQEPAIAGRLHVLHVAFGPGRELGAGRGGAEQTRVPRGSS